MGDHAPRAIDAHADANAHANAHAHANADANAHDDAEPDADTHTESASDVEPESLGGDAVAYARTVNEHGFGSAIMLALLALAGLLCLAVADAANVLVTRARAQSAADAAALAAASAQWPFLDEGDPTTAARETAEDNGAELQSCDCPERGERAVVVVSIATRIRMLGVAPSRVFARAEASLDPGRLFAPS